MTTVPLTADSTGQFSIEIDGTNTGTGAPGTATLTFPATAAVDDGSTTSLVGGDQ